VTSPQSDITRLLGELSGGNRAIVDSLMPLVYDELRAMAHRHMQRERDDHTLVTTALVHEAYLNLIKNEQLDWQSRAHFFSMAAIAMRRILVDHARQRAAEKRGGGGAMVTFDEQQIAREVPPEEFLDLDEALQRLASLDPRQATVVTYKFFGGLTHEEIAEVLGVSVPTVHRDWRLARLWLSREMKRDLTES
jgi:RNA polymerase sigma factor (TIGR02999 family)